MAMILRPSANGYEREAAMARIREYHALILAMQRGSMSDDEIKNTVMMMKAAPLELSCQGLSVEDVDQYLSQCEKSLLRYKAVAFSTIQMAKGGYCREDFTAKADAYDELIRKIGDGADRISAMNELEHIRQMPVGTEKNGLFGKKGYEKTAADAYLADIDRYISGII